MQNALGDYKTLCHDENGKCSCIQWQYIDMLNDVHEDLGFSLATKLKKKHFLWTKHKMNVKVAAQTFKFLCSKVPLTSYMMKSICLNFIQVKVLLTL